MTVYVNRDIVPDIDRIRKVRVAVAVAPDGREGICTATTNVGGALMHIPFVWGDDARDAKMREMVTEATRRAPDLDVQIREYALVET